MTQLPASFLQASDGAMARHGKVATLQSPNILTCLPYGDSIRTESGVVLLCSEPQPRTSQPNSEHKLNPFPVAAELGWPIQDRPLP